MALNVELLRESFALVVENKPNLTERFYEIFFQRYPQVKPMFGGKSSKKQQEMLAQALTLVVDHLEDGAWLTQTLGALGAKHAGYGVTNEMYGWVGDSLLATLAEAAGPAWNDELKGAWTDAYVAIASLMQAGAKVQAVAG